jgi:arabinofuranan 3-O-arabinosyltransferase
VNYGPAFLGGMIAKGGERPSAIPDYWYQDANYLDAQPHSTRVLELPGSDFASYRWDGTVATTVDPITPGLITRPYVARELIPFGSPQSSNLLDAFDVQLQGRILDPAAIAPIARFMSAGTINLRNDLTYERYLLPRPRLLWNLFGDAGGLGTPVGFGGNAPNVPDPRLPLLDETELGAPANLPNPPKVAAVPVEKTPAIVHTSPVSGAVVMAGDGSGLVNAAAAHLLTGRELVFYSGSFASDPSALRKIIGDGATLLVTDSNRKAGQRWGTISDIYGYTEMAGEQPLATDWRDQRLDVFPSAGDASRSVTEQRGGVQARATAYGNPVAYTPEDRASNAVDGNPTTAWSVGAFSNVLHQKLQLDFAEQRTADQIHLLQPQNGVRNRWITKVKLTFDDGSSEVLDLSDASRSGNGQTISFPTHTFRRVTIEIVGDSVGQRPAYPGISGVGFAEVDLGKAMPHVAEYVRLPTDLLQIAGASNVSHPLDLVLTRQRVSGSNAVRTDPELRIARAWNLPTARWFNVSGSVRLQSNTAPAATDRTLGIPDATHGGVTSSESRHLPGSVADRSTAGADGNPETAWSTGLGSAVGDWAGYTTAQPVTVSQLALRVVADGRHSVPTSLEVDVDGHAETVDLPAIADSAKPGSTRLVHVALPRAMTGTHIRFTVKGIRAVTSRDWYSQQPIDLPVAVAEWGVAGLQAPRPAARLDPACRSGLLQVDGVDVPVSLVGTAADALAGKPITFVACTPPTGLLLPSGNRTLTTTPGTTTGLDFDQVVLRSAAGGRGDRNAGPVAPTSQGPGGRAGAPGPRVEVTHQSRTSVDLKVTGVDAAQWLVLGQSFNDGWHATVGGHDLGKPTLVNGYANGWQIGPGTGAPAKAGTVVVHLRWTPQRLVNVALWISAIGGLLVLILILWPMRHRLAPVTASPRSSLDRTPSVPRPASVVRTVRYGGPRPTTKELLIAVVGFTVATGLVVTPVCGLIAGALTLVCLRIRWSRLLLVLGAPLCVAAVMAYDVIHQFRDHIPADFMWPTFFARTHDIAWMAVVLLLIDVVVDRLWLRRWWPTDDSPA